MNYMLRVPPIPIRWDSRERCQTVRVCHTPQQGTQRTLTRPSRGVERIPDDIHACTPPHKDHGRRRDDPRCAGATPARGSRSSRASVDHRHGVRAGVDDVGVVAVRGDRHPEGPSPTGIVVVTEGAVAGGCGGELGAIPGLRVSTTIAATNTPGRTRRSREAEAAVSPVTVPALVGGRLRPAGRLASRVVAGVGVRLI